VDDHAGIIGFYGEHGVCHQVANRILAAGKTGLSVEQARGVVLSYLLYGKYGSDGTFPSESLRGEMMLEPKSSFDAASELLARVLAKDLGPEILQPIKVIQQRLVAEKDRLATRVNAGEITVTEFAEQFNRLIADEAPELRKLVGGGKVDHWLALSDPVLLDVEIAREEDRKRQR
jgi:hypothetical protein